MVFNIFNKRNNELLKSGIAAIAVMFMMSIVLVSTASATVINVPGDYSTIQDAITGANAGDTISVSAGTYIEPTVGSQIVISKDLTITGADKTTTIIKPSGNTGSSGDDRGWFLVPSGVNFNLNGVTLDGEGKNIIMAIMSHGTGTIQNNIIKNIQAGVYDGRGIVTYDANMIIRGNDLSNIGRIGIYVGPGVTNAIIDANTYTGKGSGTWLDYGIEVERGGKATITGNTITNNIGVAGDLSTSAGIYVTTYFGPGTTATITGNDIKNNFDGIAVGYSAGKGTYTESSIVTAHNNNIIDNEWGINSTTLDVDAINNWWGDCSGPYHASNPGGLGNKVSDHVIFDPWTITCSTIPEFPTVALPIIAVIGLVFLFQRRKGN